MIAEKLVEEWPTRWPRPTIGSTKNSHSQVKHFARYFAGCEVDTITRDEFRRFALENPGAARYARTMLYDALDAGIVTENVGAGVKIPARRRDRITPPSEAEVWKLVVAARGLDQKVTGTSPHRNGQAFASWIVVAAFTGLREGEQRALALDDLITDHDLGGVRRGKVEFSINREEELVQPKTPASKASFAFLGASADAITAHINRASVVHSLTTVRSRRIFYLTRAERQKRWEMTRYEAGLDHVRWHDLRHFCATWLLDQGATMDDVALQLRCSVDEIRRTYGHPDREAALSRLEEIARG